MHNSSITGYLSLLLLTLFILGCDKTQDHEKTKADISTQKNNYYIDQGKWKAPKPLLKELKNQISRPAILRLHNGFAVLQSTKKDIIFHYLNNKVNLDDAGGTNKLWLFTDTKKKDIYAIWWKKTRTGKHLYFRKSSDEGKTFSKTSILNTAGGVLPQISFSSDGNGNLLVAYYDERNPPYRIYINRSSDNGKTWNAVDVRMDNDNNNLTKKIKDKEIPVAYAINPIVRTLKSGKMILIWEQKKLIDGQYRLQLVSRVSQNKGETWGEEQVIFTPASNFTIEYSVATNGTSIVIVAALPKLGLLGFYAEDNFASEGFSWKALGSVAGTVDVNEISWLKPAISSNQYKVAYIIEKDVGKKHHVEVASLDLKKGKWGSVFQLDRSKHQPVETKATYLDLKALPNGEFVAAWEDYQSIIPTLMIDYTENNGTTWQKEPIKITRSGLSQIKYPNIYIGDKNATVVFEWYVSRGDRLPALSYIELPIDKSGLDVVPAPQGKKLTEPERKKLLKKRVSKFMDLRVKKDWEKTWEFMDPVYRQVTKKDSWMRNMGYISYEKYRIVKLETDGNFATATVDMTISLRQQFREGRIMEPTPSKSASTETKWLWFYDNWYFYPESEFIRHLNF